MHTQTQIEAPAFTQIEAPAFTLMANIGGSEAAYEIAVTWRELREATVGKKWDVSWDVQDTYESRTTYAQVVYKNDTGAAVLFWDEPYFNPGNDAPHENLQLVWYEFL